MFHIFSNRSLSPGYRKRHSSHKRYSRSRSRTKSRSRSNSRNSYNKNNRNNRVSKYYKILVKFPCFSQKLNNKNVTLHKSLYIL